MLLYCNISAILIRCKGGTPASWSMFLISTGMQNVQVSNKVVTWQTWIANEWLDLFCHNSETLISKSARSVILTADSSKLDHSMNNLIKITSLICSNKSDVATHQICQSGSKDLILIRLLHEVKKKSLIYKYKMCKVSRYS